jgi:coproporphyrinogen III oxidase-like Fe-S oxidoreductase
MKPQSNNRDLWPYAALLPHSVKVYPVVQVADRVGAQPAGDWPPPMDAKVAEWRERTASSEDVRNQIYLHVPFCPFLCPFCPLYKVSDIKERTGDSRVAFVEHLIREIEMYGRVRAATEQTYHAVYFGGGTPTELTPEQLVRILNALRQNFQIAPDAEITLEGVARQMLAPGYLEACFAGGFNRISFGVQSLDGHVRAHIGRGDRVEDYPALVERVKSINPDIPINVDMMAGLPGQTYDVLERDVRTVIQWGVDSLDVLYYVNMPGTLLYKKVADGRRDAPTYGADMLQMRTMVNQLLGAAGYKQVTGEVFTRGDRDVFVETSFGGGGNGLNTVLALGPSAFGLINGTVYHNIADLGQYKNDINAGKFPVNTAERLGFKTAKRRALLLAILKLNIPAHLVDTWQVKRLVRRWQTLGLVEAAGKRYRLTQQGALWYNLMQMELLTVADQLQLVRMFGSPEEQRRMFAKNEGELHTHERELLAMVRSNRFGTLRLMGYRAYLLLHQLPWFDRRAVGFTGPIDEQLLMP